MKQRGFEPVSTPQNAGPSPLPLRGSRTSAGYDFYAVEDISVPPQGKARFTTDVKAYMRPGEMLLLVVRSSAGIKRDLMLANTLGVIDSDFYGNPDNDGNISIVLRNLQPALRLDGYRRIGDVDVPQITDLTEENTVHIKAGERVVQGIFVPVLESDNCNSGADRLGGLGSSGL